jgi:hypothetical protein
LVATVRRVALAAATGRRTAFGAGTALRAVFRTALFRAALFLGAAFLAVVRFSAALLGPALRGAARFFPVFPVFAVFPDLRLAAATDSFRAADFFFAPPFRAAAEVLLARFTAFFRPPLAEPFRFAITRSFRNARNQQLP